MGWYITCNTCGQQEKYMHPACGCLEKKRKVLLDKLVGATVHENYVDQTNYPYIFLNTHYKKSVDGKMSDLYISTVIENCSGEMSIHETIFEIDEEGYHQSKNHKNQSTDDVKTSLEDFDMPSGHEKITISSNSDK